MIAMLLVPDTTLRSLGLGAVIVGVVSVLVALTFHPALLMVLGDRVDRLRVPWLGRRDRGVGRRGGTRLATRGPCRHAPSRDQPDRHHGACCWRSPLRCSTCAWATAGRRRCRTTPRPSRACSRCSATSRAARPTPSRIVVDGSANDAATQQGLTRLRAELAADRDFAAGALTVETGPRIAVASLPLSVEPTSERASAAIDRLRDGLRPARVRRGRGPRLRRRRAGRGARQLRGQQPLAADRDRRSCWR